MTIDVSGPTLPKRRGPQREAEAYARGSTPVPEWALRKMEEFLSPAATMARQRERARSRSYRGASRHRNRGAAGDRINC